MVTKGQIHDGSIYLKSQFMRCKNYVQNIMLLSRSAIICCAALPYIPIKYFCANKKSNCVCTSVAKPYLPLPTIKMGSITTYQLLCNCRM